MRNFINGFGNINMRNTLFFLGGMFLVHGLVAMEIETIVDFPTQYIPLCKTLENMVQDTSDSGTLKIPLPASPQTINDVFAIFDAYNPDGDQTKIRNKLKNYSLSKLVDVANLLQHLDASDSIMEMVMDRIAAVLNDMFTQLFSSLHDYISGHNKNIVLPYYEPLRKLNSDIEKIVKKSVKIKDILLWQIKDIWGIMGMHNSDQMSIKEKQLFEEGTETIVSFLDRNIVTRVLKFIEDDQKKKHIAHDDTLIKSPDSQSLSNGMAALFAAGIAKLRELYNYYMSPQRNKKL